MKNKILISVTGKSGTGKSTFSKMLAKFLNAEIFELDRISHLSLKDDKIKEELLLVFGNKIFDESGEIIRKELGKHAFNDGAKLKILNKLSQDFMENHTQMLIENSAHKYIILEYALLSQMKFFSESDYKILMKSSDEIRKNRVLIRDNISKEYLENREKNLPSYQEKDFDEIIENNESFFENLELIAKITSNNIIEKFE